MGRASALLVLAMLSPGLAGCVAGTIVDVVTAPVKVAGKAVDLATTSQSEADEKRGRDLRKREERYGKVQRDWAREDRSCTQGKEDACIRRDALLAELDALRPGLPAERQ